MYRSLAIVLVVLSAVLCSGCMGGGGGVGWSVTPYGGVGGSTNSDYQRGLTWQAGLSFTLYNQYPAAPAVPQFPGYYRNDVRVNNDVSSASNSNSSSSSTSSATQSQTQDQSQSQSQTQGQTQTGGGSGGSGDCHDGDHGHGHDGDPDHTGDDHGDDGH